MQQIEAEFGVGESVLVGGCKDLVLTVTAVSWRHPNLINYECSWFCDGDAKSAVIEGYRLSRSGV